MLSKAGLTEVYGAWALRWPSDVLDLLDGYSGTWWIGGSFAIDAALGDDTQHDDIDVVIPRTELSLLRGWLGRSFHFWSVFQGALKPLRPSDSDVLPIGTQQVWLRRSAYSLWEYDIALDPSDSETWRFRRDLSVQMPLGEALIERNGVRFAKPEIVLAHRIGARDADASFDRAVPALDADARAWLAERLPAEHAWRDRLEVR